MVLKQAFLREERLQIEAFLTRFDLVLDQDVDHIYYFEEAGQIIATLSSAGDTIKAVAVDPEYQGESLALQLFEEATKRFAKIGIDSFRVFTKTKYAPQFASMKMRLLASTDTVAILEGGSNGIDSTIQGIRDTIENITKTDLTKLDLGTVVVNCNPVTKGHLGLMEYAARKHDFLIVFVLEEDRSFFSFKERYALLHLALMNVPNAIMVPSSKYIVSALTFPSYFLKTVAERDFEHAKLDAILFRDYFMPKLHLKMRYIGTETDAVMVLYNNTLLDILHGRIELIQRYTQDDSVISASLVRKLIQAGDIDSALALVPEATRGLLEMIAWEKRNHVTK